MMSCAMLYVINYVLVSVYFFALPECVLYWYLYLLGMCNDANALLPVFARQQSMNDMKPLSQLHSVNALGSSDGSYDQTTILRCDPAPTTSTLTNTDGGIDRMEFIPNTLDSDSALCEMPYESPRNAMSLVGTYGYMAPEMVLLMSSGGQSDSDSDSLTSIGYTKAVDWWSLGVTMYKFLEGPYPFNVNIKVPEDAGSNTLRGVALERYAALFAEVEFFKLKTEYQEDAIDIINKFLNVTDKKRLGYGRAGSEAISSHIYFKSIN